MAGRIAGLNPLSLDMSKRGYGIDNPATGLGADSPMTGITNGVRSAYRPPDVGRPESGRPQGATGTRAYQPPDVGRPESGGPQGATGTRLRQMISPNSQLNRALYR